MMICQSRIACPIPMCYAQLIYLPMDKHTNFINQKIGPTTNMVYAII
jgi:hypothetical protein